MAALVGLAAVLVPSPAAQAQIGCQPTEYTAEPPGMPSLQHLCQPVRIEPQRAPGGGTVLDTQMLVGLVKRWVPSFVRNQGWSWTTHVVRGYGVPLDPSKPIDTSKLPDNYDWQNPVTKYVDPEANVRWLLPGPTLLATKGIERGSTGGTRLRLELINRLPKMESAAQPCNTDYFCWPEKENPTRAEKQACLLMTTPACADATVGGQTVACEARELDQEPPECFHGDNVTNLHYHGTHVSPQRHQDYVLLSLYPKGTPGVVSPPPPAGERAVGTYQTDIDPFPWNQAEGTHWYHPHKHGSTALQVVNGMSGALLIMGPFDDWLQSFYYPDHDGMLLDKVLVVNQLWGKDPSKSNYPNDPELNLYRNDAGFSTDHPLVNGQANPIIFMKQGEVQRWRFIGATMQASATLEIGFEGGDFDLVQIAQDGVQFSYDNYLEQPYKDMDGTFENVRLAPGNRVDLLVRAPMKSGMYMLTHRLAHEIHEDKMDEKMEMMRAATMENMANPPLLTVMVQGSGPRQPLPCEGPSGIEPQPGCWYNVPYEPDDPAQPQSGFLTSIDSVSKQRMLMFGMVGQTGFGSRQATGPVGQNCFYVGKADLPRAQYDASCAFFDGMVVGTAEEWRVTNNSPPNHPFHIHINPFLLLSEKGILNGQVVNNTYDPPIWQDTVSLPGSGTGPVPASSDTECQASAECQAVGGRPSWTPPSNGNPGTCNCSVDGGSVTLRQRYEDFTGGFVTHCHFLGHEDRGMMQNLQTVCKDGKYDQPEPGKSECETPGTLPALPECTDNPQCPQYVSSDVAMKP